MKDRVIVNSAIGAWWTLGQARLKQSLYDVGYSGDSMFYANQDINEYFDPSNPYTTKAAAIKAAIEKGYRYILWLDCSLWSIKNPDSFFDLFKDSEGYFMKSGFNCAQTTNDHAARIAGYNHDQLEKMPELWSCIFGFDMHNEKSKKCAELFVEYCKEGVFNGSRNFNPNECSDSRFLFSRQDQTALSLVVHKSGIETINEPSLHIIQDDGGTETKDTYFRMRGGIV